MPCSKGMRNCRANCLHRRNVESYFWARKAWEAAAEAATAGYAAEMAAYAATNPPPTFRDWLEGGRDHARLDSAA